MQAVTQSLSDGLGAILGALPALIGAIIILVIGFIIAKVLQGIVTRVLEPTTRKPRTLDHNPHAIPCNGGKTSEQKSP